MIGVHVGLAVICWALQLQRARWDSTGLVPQHFYTFVYDADLQKGLRHSSRQAVITSSIIIISKADLSKAKQRSLSKAKQSTCVKEISSGLWCLVCVGPWQRKKDKNGVVVVVREYSTNSGQQGRHLIQAKAL